MNRHFTPHSHQSTTSHFSYALEAPDPRRARLLHGVLVMRQQPGQQQQTLTLMDPEDACKELGIPAHSLRFTTTVEIQDPGTAQVRTLLSQILENMFS